MENISLLEKIKSKYITEIITSYCNDNYLILKLFKYSKYYHKQLKINLLFFQENFLNKRIKWENYLCKNDIFTNVSELKDDLKRKLLPFNLDYKILTKIVTNYFLNKSKEKDLEYDQKLSIAIYSPFFDFLSKTNFFSDLFTLKIAEDTYELHNFDYNSLNLIFDYKAIKNINHPMISSINFKKLNYLEISTNFPLEVNRLFNIISSSKDLIYLSLSMNKDFNVSSKSFEFINTFKSLKALNLQNIIFNNKAFDVLRLKINSLKKLSFKYVKNIIIDKSTYLKLKSFTFEFSEIIVNNKEGENNLPELEELYFCSGCIRNYNLFNFGSLNQLKRFKGEKIYFLLLKSPLLEEVDLEDEIIEFEELKKIFDKIYTLKFLKKISLKLGQRGNIDLSEIFGKNESITEINIKISNENDLLLFYHLQNSFLNLTNLNMETNTLYYEEGCGKQFEFIESPISKVKNIHLIINKFSNFKIFCQFKILESIHLEIWGINENNHINIFPLLSDKCNVIFNSLKTFELLINAVEINSDLLENIYNNLENMPNLINFKLICKPKDISGKFHKAFLKKILSMKYIKRIDIKIFKYKYVNKKLSFEELMKIFPDINFYNFYEVNIIDDIVEYYEGREEEIEKYYKNEKKDKILILENKENENFCSDCFSQIIRNIFG